MSNNPAFSSRAMNVAVTFTTENVLEFLEQSFTVDDAVDIINAYFARNPEAHAQFVLGRAEKLPE